MEKGWISIHRKIQDHWIWQENREFSKAEAWIDILFTVNHKEQKIMIKNSLMTVKRGESIMALQTWADRWNWSKSKVRRFFDLLQKDNMIEVKNERITTRLKVCNYDSYQDWRNANETQVKRKRNANETQTALNNNDNNINNDNNENKRDSALDFLMSKKPTALETFIMQNKRYIDDWKRLTESFQDTVDMEIAQNKLTYEADILFPRFKKYCRSWISNQKQDKGVSRNFGNSKVIGKSNQIQ